MGDISHESDDIIDPKFIRQLKITSEICNALRDLSSDPLRKSLEERIQRSIIENINAFKQEKIIPDKEEKEDKENIINICEKLSPGEIYILRIIDNELEVVENKNGDSIYKVIKISI